MGSLARSIPSSNQHWPLFATQAALIPLSRQFEFDKFIIITAKSQLL